MKKEVASVYYRNVSYRINRRTGVVSAIDVDGSTRYPEETEAEAVRAELARRDRSAANRRSREAALRSCGLVKVRGALGGIYWE